MHDPIEKHVYQPLRVTFGLVPIVAGLDKFTNLLTDWSHYVSPLAADLLPITPPSLMHLVGVVEIAVGALIFTRWTRLGAYLAAGWLTCIALNLVSMGILDVAVRDLVMAVAAYGLAHLAMVYAPSPTRSQRSLQPTTVA